MACRKEPPAAIQNAMMTKDKKPFTYTPGGLDLNEIKSPRMAKRLSRNAHLEDRYDHKDNSQMYQQQPPTMHNQMPQSPNQYVSQSPNPYVPQSLNQFASQSPNPYVPQSPNPYVSQSPNPYVSQSPNPYVSQSPNPYAQQLNQHQAAAQPPRGWSPVKSPPVQSKSFRVLQKITGSDQEAFGENAKSDGEVLFLVNRVQPRRDSPSFREMTSPPVYTMPPNYPPPPQSYYSPRSPTYDTNGQPGESEY